MNPWIAKALVLAGTVVMIAIRAPHGHRSRIVKVATSYKTPLETGLLVLAWVGFFVPLIWVASPAFSFAEYALGTGPLVAGVMCLVIGLWLFYRSHADLSRIFRCWQTLRNLCQREKVSAKFCPIGASDRHTLVGRPEKPYSASK